MAVNLKNDNSSEDSIITEINVTPFIDIMLVLLIIFMVTSSVTFQSGLEVDIPKITSKSPEKKDQPSAVLISVDQMGAIFVDGEPVKIENLEEMIKSALSKNKTDMIIFQGDKSSSLQNTLDIIDVAKKAGAQKFAIAAKEV
jgi:biopolymer transport protein ExbD